MLRTNGLPHRLLVGLLAAAVLGAVGTALVTLAPSARADTGCRADYRVDQWAGGFTAYVDITAGASGIRDWSVTWTYGAGQEITSSWGARVTQTGGRVNATGMSWNADVAPAARAEFGVQGSWTGSNPVPTDIAVTGIGCSSIATVTQTPGAGPSLPVSGAPAPQESASAPVSPTASATPTAPPMPTPSAGASEPPSPNPPADCAAAVLCDDFESLAVGPPTGTWTSAYPDCSGTGVATIDTSVAHSGGQSLKVAGAAGYCNHVFVTPTASLADLGPLWYGRFYVRHTTALPADHVTFMAMRDAADDGKDLRMGGQNAALQWNRQSDDATLPEQSPTGVALSAPLPTDEWTCVEFEVDSTTATMATWVNSGEVAGLRNDGTPTSDVDGQWLRRAGWKPALTDFRLGWEAYGNGADTLWFDDVALGAERIGC